MGRGVNQRLAELLGVLVADGNVYTNVGARVYRIKVAGDKRHEQAYFRKHLTSLFVSEFGVVPRLYAYPNNNGLECYFYSKEVAEQLLGLGMVRNKSKQSPRIPRAIISDNALAAAFIRGFFDCDGTVYRKYGSYLQLGFRNADRNVLKLLAKLLMKLGYHPSVTLKHKNVFIHRQGEVKRFFNEVVPANEKHWLRFERLKEAYA
jgi:DNA-binding transcriptional regulator WhiA